MKLDKETVIKQRFWFLLPVFAICLLVSWICVLGVRSETETNYKSATDKKKTLDGIAGTQEIKNTNWIEAMTKEFDTSAAKKNELWDMEADRQSKIARDGKERKIVRKTPFITWPERTRAQWMKTSGGRDLYEMDFGEFLGNVPKDEYLEEYRPQFESVASIIKDWLDESNPNNVTGAVRVLGASGNNRNYVIPRLLIPYGLDHSKHVLSDEIYLLQEDLAVKREIFTSLAELLDSYSKLKTEWNEVPYVEIKEAAAPAAPVAAAAGTPAADATNPAPAAAAAKKDPEPEVYQSYRFYNYIWPNFLNTNEVEQDAKLKATVVDLKLPAVDPYKGWRLDFTVGQDPKDEKKLVLRTVSGNHSSVYTLPVQPLMIWYAELGTDKEVATPLYLNDAGNVGPSEYWPNLTIKKISQKKLNDISLPANFGRITRITRVHPENALDQQVVFNNDWALNVQLVRRANSPTLTLRGEIINRSGRRLPVAAFTAGLTLPNTENLLNEEFKVATDAFNAGERRTFTQEVKNPIPPRTISMVKQKLTWRSTPIKRIDRLEIGRVAHNNSDRLKTMPLVPYDFKRKDPLNQNVVAPVAASGGAAGPGNLSSEGGGALGGNAGMLGGATSGGADSAPTATANHGIPLQRYVQVSSELRRMPVALVMVVDATAMTDIIAAMSNSRLRFQVTMAPWTKVPNLGRPGNAGTGASAPPPGPGASQGPTGAAGGGKAGGVGGGSGGTGPSGSGASLSAGGGVVGAGTGAGSGGTGPGAGQGPGAGAGNTPPPAGEIGLGDDSSVVELQIYGLITVYESPDEFKRMEKLKANPPAAATATPGTPSTGSAPGK